MVRETSWRNWVRADRAAPAADAVVSDARAPRAKPSLFGARDRHDQSSESRCRSAEVPRIWRPDRNLLQNWPWSKINGEFRTRCRAEIGSRRHLRKYGLETLPAGQNSVSGRGAAWHPGRTDSPASAMRNTSFVCLSTGLVWGIGLRRLGCVCGRRLGTGSVCLSARRPIWSSAA